MGGQGGSQWEATLNQNSNDVREQAMWLDEKKI